MNASVQNFDQFECSIQKGKKMLGTFSEILGNPRRNAEGKAEGTYGKFGPPGFFSGKGQNIAFCNYFF